MKVKSDVHLPVLNPVSQNNVVPANQTSVSTQSSVVSLHEAQVSPAWQTFSAQAAIATSTELPLTGQSALRSQIQLASGQLPDSGNLMSAEVMAQRLGVDVSRLTMPANSQVAMVGNTVATGSDFQATEMASRHTSGGVGTSTTRAEAQVAFEAVMEQRFMPFDTKSDDMARNLVKNTSLLESLSVSEKAQLIQIMGSGSVGGADQSGILQTLTSAKSPAEFQQIVQLAGGEVALRDMLSGSHEREFAFLIDKFATGAMPVDHPLREEARGAFEKTLHQHHGILDTKADNMARELAANPRLLEALSPLEKGRLVQILGSGITTEGDESAMIKVLKSTTNAQEFWTTVQAAGGPEFINSKVDWKEQGQFDYLIDKFRRNPGVPTQPGMMTQANGTLGPNPNTGMNPMSPTMGTMGMNPMWSQPSIYAPDLLNPWSVSPVINYDALYAARGMAPSYGAGMVTGMGQPYDLGIGRAISNAVGGIFRSIVGAVTNTLRMALNVAVSAGIGFLMGGPAGAAMGAANGLMGQMSGLLGSMGMGSLSSMLPMLFSTMMGVPAPMMGLGSAMGSFGPMMGMF